MVTVAVFSPPFPVLIIITHHSFLARAFVKRKGTHLMIEKGRIL
jgi:hypothetical protein